MFVTSINKLLLQCFVDFCKMEQICRPAFYRLSANSQENCVTGCRQNNKEYVKFLNENIYISSSALNINSRLYVIKLNPIDSYDRGCLRVRKQIPSSVYVNQFTKL